MIVQTDGVVLHAMKYRDTSKIVSLYTKKFGKIKVIAKGVRSQKNKFGSSLEPMSISSVVMYKKEQRDLHLLSKSEIAVTLSNLYNHSDRMFIGLALIELVNMVMHDEEENEAVYNLLVQALQALNDAQRNHLNIFLSFMVKLFEQFGFGLTLSKCLLCGKTIETVPAGALRIRLSDGKMICPDCASTHHSSGMEIQGGVVKSLYYFQNNEIHKSPLLTLAPLVQHDALSVMQSYLRYHIEGVRTLRSLSLLYSTQ